MQNHSPFTLASFATKQRRAGRRAERHQDRESRAARTSRGLGYDSVFARTRIEKVCVFFGENIGSVADFMNGLAASDNDWYCNGTAALSDVKNVTKFVRILGRTESTTRKHGAAVIIFHDLHSMTRLSSSSSSSSVCRSSVSAASDWRASRASTSKLARTPTSMIVLYRVICSSCMTLTYIRCSPVQ
jgi:hypothetical protein